MTTELIPRPDPPPAIRDLVADLAALTVEQLRAELARTMEATARTLLRLAAVVHELDRRGDTLADLRSDLVGWLRRIAAGTVLPEVVVRYQGRPMLLQRLASLPATEQEPFGRGEPVTLVVPDGQGGYTQRAVQPSALGREQISQLFTGDGRLRSTGEQKVYLDELTLRERRSPRKKRQAGRVRTDLERGGITVGRAFVPLAEVLTALAGLRDAALPEIDGDPVSVPVQMSPAEHRRLKSLAAQSGTTMSDLIRRALGAAGMLSEGE